MAKTTLGFIYRILNIWFSYIAILITMTVFPHLGDIHFLSWVIEAIYFLLFLLSTTVAIKDNHNRDIFINISIFFFFSSFSFINNYIGNHSLFGNDDLMYHFFVYKKLIANFMLNFMILYVVMKYLLLRKNPFMVYIITFLLTASIFAYNFHPYLTDPHYFHNLGEDYLTDLYPRIFLNQALPVIFLVFFGYRVYKKDVSMGTYLNVLMSIFFIYLVINLIDVLSVIYHFQIFSIKLYFLAVSLIPIAIVLFKKLCFSCTEYGQFYENLINGKIDFGKLKIQKRNSHLNAFVLKAMKIYFSQRIVSAISFMGFLIFAFFYFPLSKLITLNVTAVCMCILVLFIFINGLFKKREKAGHIIK